MVGNKLSVTGDVSEENPSIGGPGEEPDQHQGH